ncbi:MAG TPA: tRNA (5-methylaminomethyl-2-thiouridine)(34)-methyltransferase MnmD [Bacteroidales bacterium]|nr:tRNA (5-methylaminomethyl-2-thiouridine)(34)-methyltransferase MnmD [Bacteroidales bacterium]
MLPLPDRRLIVTDDGSHTYALEGVNKHYHSTFGALQESRHVFIENGLKKVLAVQDSIRILEVGFGTGLNALLSFIEGGTRNAVILYHALEPYPLNAKEYSILNYPQLLEYDKALQVFLSMHEAPWGKETAIAKGFLLKKYLVSLHEAKLPEKFFDLVYYDAFGPDEQPEMWELGMFKKVFTAMRTGGILTTYCSKGGVRRGLRTAGFYVIKLPGPKGKREITHALKLK